MLRNIMLISVVVFTSVTCFAGNSDFSFEINNADNRPSIMLNKDGYSISGGTSREKEVSVSVKKDMFRKTPLTLNEKIKALKTKIAYYEFLKKFKINPSNTFDLIYKEKPLKEALNELLPNVPVVFKDVDENIKIKDLMASSTSIETIVEYLDDAAGVYFEFSKDKLVIKKTP